MRLSRELAGAVYTLIGLQLVTAVSAIGLLHRMTPAIEQILEDNVVSLEAAEDMLMLTAHCEPFDAVERDRFDAALARARNNVTEREEIPLLDRLEADVEALAAGDGAVRARMVVDLEALAEVNRASMIRADVDAQRLGMAGAWSAALFGVASFALGQVLVRRLRHRIEGPLVALDAAIDAYRRGDAHRRCVRFDGPEEIRRIRDNANWLMDLRAPQSDPTRHASRLCALNALLDLREEPSILLGEGAVLAANRAALALAPDPRVEDPRWTRRELGDGLTLVTRVDHAESEGTSGSDR